VDYPDKWKVGTGDVIEESLNYCDLTRKNTGFSAVPQEFGQRVIVRTES
jgi:hypothetical protein